MYSPSQQQEYTDHLQQQTGAVPVVNRNSRLFYNHQRQNSFGTVASAITMSPRSGYPDNNNSQNWFGTSLDSNGSSFGQSPIFAGRDLIVSPSTSTGHLDNNFNTTSPNDEDETQQRK